MNDDAETHTPCEVPDPGRVPEGPFGWTRDDIARCAREVLITRQRIGGMPRGQEEPALRVFTNRVAAIVAKTYCERGDEATLADDLALMLIRDLLVELDPAIVECNVKKRVWRHA
jgi:hypothetical protein